MTCLLSRLEITVWTTHEARSQRTKLCFLWFIALFPNCWSVVAVRTSDRFGSLSVCSVLPTAPADEDPQWEVQVRATLFSQHSNSGLLIRVVWKSAAGSRLYGRPQPTSPYSLELHCLVPQHMAVSYCFPFEVCFKWLSLAEPQAFSSALSYCVWDEDKHL